MVVMNIALETAKPQDKDIDEEERRGRALAWFDSIRNVRYATDVFD